MYLSYGFLDVFQSFLIAGWSNLPTVEGQVIFKMSRTASLRAQGVFHYHLVLSHQLTHTHLVPDSYPLLQKIQTLLL